MSYRRRLTFAAVFSVAAHIAVLASLGRSIQPHGPASLRNEPIVLELRPERPPPRRQLVDAPTRAEETVQDTGLIAEASTKAADQAEHDEAAAAPRVEEVTGFEQVAAEPQPSPAPPPTPVRARQDERHQPESSREQVAALIPEAGDEIMPHDERAAAEPEPDAAFEPVAAEMPSGPDSVLPRSSTGRVQGGVKRQGVMAFEAIESEIAPYLKEIQRRVELNWRTALHLRYSGTSPTRAVLDCVIGPDGHIISVDIVEAGDSVTFAPICKNAIESAGPFEPFPFDVPDIYRSRNLEIRWTFNFL